MNAHMRDVGKATRGPNIYIDINSTVSTSLPAFTADTDMHQTHLRISIDAIIQIVTDGLFGKIFASGIEKGIPLMARNYINETPLHSRPQSRAS